MLEYESEKIETVHDVAVFLIHAMDIPNSANLISLHMSNQFSFNNLFTILTAIIAI